MARTVIVDVFNNTGSTLVKGKAVCLVGFNSADGLPLINHASYDNADRMPAVGIIDEDIDDNTAGTITTCGIVEEMNAEGTKEGDDVFVGLDGEIVFEQPSEDGAIVQQLGVVGQADNSGSILLIPLELIRKIDHDDLLNVTPNQHHNQIHANTHWAGGDDSLDHGTLPGLNDDDHLQYALTDGSRPCGGASIPGPIKYTVTAIKTLAYSANINEVVNCNPTGGAFIVTLPTAVGVTGQTVLVKNVTASSNMIIIEGFGGQLIDGFSYVVIEEGYKSVTFVSTGAAWYRI